MALGFLSAGTTKSVSKVLQIEPVHTIFEPVLSKIGPYIAKEKNLYSTFT